MYSITKHVFNWNIKDRISMKICVQIYKSVVEIRK